MLITNIILKKILFSNIYFYCIVALKIKSS
jgi:hypothetical protein